MNDPIGDLIVRLKNGGNAGKTNILVPFSKMKFAIAELLSAKGFVGSVSKKTKNDIPKSIIIELLYDGDGNPVISGTERVSKPSRRLYKNSREIKPFRRGFGMTVFSTPKGIMSDADARKEKIGGEVLFNIW